MKVCPRVSGGTVTGYAIFCPGCGNAHVFNVEPGPNGVGGQKPVWTFNGDMERPTFRASMLAQSGHYASDRQGKSCWCTWNAEHPDQPAPFTCYRCHSFITDGRIQFLDDCTHSLRGQTVDLPDFPES